MANEQNLIPGNMRSQREARENGRKGGKASGQARRFKADFKAAFLEALEDKDGKALKNIVKGLIKSAADGNHKAAELIRDTIGQKPAEKQEVKVDGKIVFTWEE